MLDIQGQALNCCGVKPVSEIIAPRPHLDNGNYFQNDLKFADIIVIFIYNFNVVSELKTKKLKYLTEKNPLIAFDMF